MSHIEIVLYLSLCVAEYIGSQESKDMSDLFKAIQNTSTKSAPSDKLDQIRALAKSLRNLSLEIQEDTEKLSVKKVTKYNLETKELPELFSECNIKYIELEAEGNYPSIDIESKMSYKAVLPRDETTNEVKPEGLDWLEKNKHGDLIKRLFIIELPTGDIKRAKALRALLKKNKYSYLEERNVHHMTLTSFVKDMVTKGKAIPLDILGATIGKIVKMKVREPK